MKLLFIGDVVGEAGCTFLQKRLPGLRRSLGADLTVVNGENSANGNGITAYSADMLFAAGADCITTGNHAFQRRTDLAVFERDCVIRPANYSDACPGRGVCVLDLGACTVAVVNLMGVLYMEALDNPFTVIDAVLGTLDTPNIFVDFHAEATSEKRAMGFYLDSRVTAVVGTHTHVPTADACILPGGTGYQTDAGMTGVEQSVLGVDIGIATDRMRLHTPVRFTEARGDCYLCGTLVEFDQKSGKCSSIRSVIER
ncbi:MAG: YmdB family metallophosphoesterase [Oscillospiraceae bacterium]|nr:YmdB family metallophosphoesterase [Oscillospiraceae bacterium]